MTVKELIEELNKLDPNISVVSQPDCGWFVDIKLVQERFYNRDEDCYSGDSGKDKVKYPFKTFCEIL